LRESSSAAQILRANFHLLECFMLVSHVEPRLAWVMNIGF